MYIIEQSGGCHSARLIHIRRMDDDLPMAEFYEQKVDVLRRLILQAHDDAVRRDLTLLAHEFEHLAEYARRKGRVQIW
jgi:hypothetical protein